jgi:hypothetical protein
MIKSAGINTIQKTFLPIFPAIQKLRHVFAFFEMQDFVGGFRCDRRKLSIQKSRHFGGGFSIVKRWIKMRG